MKFMKRFIDSFTDRPIDRRNAYDNDCRPEAESAP